MAAIPARPPLSPKFQTEATSVARSIGGLTHDLDAANETIALFTAAYRKIAVEYHISKIGGTASHAGSFEHCKNKGCVEHRKLLDGIAKPKT